MAVTVTVSGNDGSISFQCASAPPSMAGDGSAFRAWFVSDRLLRTRWTAGGSEHSADVCSVDWIESDLEQFELPGDFSFSVE